ncbi:MAG TPA: GNAT family N-acetyltransferase [Candidatus Omnitrophota bacterium]|nr:GNAT family N-acetyltransferase [Candidatus Omnitrophota bacterium]HPS19711.1 GNAT family N-acetyltransferase [Candidatus Omnitrophota bacterium]
MNVLKFFRALLDRKGPKGAEAARIKYINASIRDAEEILSLQKEAYQSEAALYGNDKIAPLTQTIEDLKEQFKTRTILKAVLKNKIVGTVRAYQDGGTCYIERLAVLSEARNQGIGTALLRKIEDMFAAERYELFTGAKSLKNIALYQKQGYRIFKKEQKGCGGIEIVYLEKTK